MSPFLASLRHPLYGLGIALLLGMGVVAQLRAAPEPFKIGVLYWSMNIPGQVAMAKGLEAEAKAINQAAAGNAEPGVELTTRVAGDGEAGIERQIEQMRELIALAPRVIIVQPTDNAALSAPLREANAAGIPVVAYDQYISGGTLAAYITSDNYQAGYLGGEYMASLFGRERAVNMVLVDYPLVSSTVERVDGFLDGLRDQQLSYKILATYQAVEPIAGRKAAVEILRNFPKPGSLDMVFVVNDGAGVALVKALAEAGRSDIMVASIDGDPESVDNIRDKRMTRYDGAQFCGPLGAAAMRTAYDLARGKQVKKHQLIPVFPVTRETICDYPGWMGPIPHGFDKPWKARQPRWTGID